ncbi:helix-turn-helix domain-containing protein [Bacillus sp. MSP13]|uniref:helix-turn-helix domain-containing protein n=1 Tax=Bacillus sp. MSP13 TaxID=1071061 RepID=UPI001E554ECE|nr:helix-turn-helix transcriptional regulator [Bacillus sp. MSP13]
MNNINTLRKKRNEKGWSQYRLAEESGVSQATISAIENGNRQHSLHKNIMRIAVALGIKVEELTDPLKDGGD